MNANINDCVIDEGVQETNDQGCAFITEELIPMDALDDENFNVAIPQAHRNKDMVALISDEAGVFTYSKKINSGDSPIVIVGIQDPIHQTTQGRAGEEGGGGDDNNGGRREDRDDRGQVAGNNDDGDANPGQGGGNGANDEPGAPEVHEGPGGDGAGNEVLAGGPEGNQGGDGAGNWDNNGQEAGAGNHGGQFDNDIDQGDDYAANDFDIGDGGLSSGGTGGAGDFEGGSNDGDDDGDKDALGDDKDGAGASGSGVSGGTTLGVVGASDFGGAVKAGCSLNPNAGMNPLPASLVLFAALLLFLRKFSMRWNTYLSSVVPGGSRK